MARGTPSNARARVRRNPAPAGDRHRAGRRTWERRRPSTRHARPAAPARQPAAGGWDGQGADPNDDGR
jgi:hypothetical protein